MEKRKILTRARRLFRASAAPAYALILVRIFEAVQHADFIGRMMGAEDALALVRDWGWVVGVAWLAYLVLAPSRGETLHAANAERLRRQLVRLVQRIERLSLLYEVPEFNASGHRAALQDRRRDLLQYSVADLLEYVLAAIPQDYRSKYELNAVAGAIVDLLKTPPEQLSALAREGEPTITSGLGLYLDRHRNEGARTDDEG